MLDISDAMDHETHDFGWLFAKYQPRIYGYIRALVTHRNDAEDVFQETASVLWQKFENFQPGSDFLAWALQVARYEVLHFWQRQKRNVLRFSEPFIDAIDSHLATESSRLGDLSELLFECMKRLSPADRELFMLRYQSDMAVTNLAVKLGRPPTTIYDSINRSRRMLTACVERAMRKETHK